MCICLLCKWWAHFISINCLHVYFTSHRNYAWTEDLREHTLESVKHHLTQWQFPEMSVECDVAVVSTAFPTSTTSFLEAANTEFMLIFVCPVSISYSN